MISHRSNNLPEEPDEWVETVCFILLVLSGAALLVILLVVI
jgi:hypothetical protein